MIQKPLGRRPLTDEQQELLSLKREQLALKERQVELREGLPFLHGWKWYTWAKEFYDSHEKLNFLCAANQISKSSTQIRKAINWATDKSLWPKLWPKHLREDEPKVFWYLYPSAPVATAEFETKWQQFLPKGKFKDDPVYGWRHVIKNKEIHAIYFNSGAIIYFRAYSQDTSNLQTGTVYAIFCDEELPMEHYEELMFRLTASDGFFHMVFTATLGQAFWHSVIEGQGEQELLPMAWKRQVSMYDCQLYEDGTPSHWTLDKIRQAESRCSTHQEVLKRVWGKFIKDEGLKYPQFDVKKHKVEGHHLPKGWNVYAGVDYGSGGAKGHPAAICFVGVSPDFQKGRVFLAWRGDGIPTTAGDVVLKYIEMKTEHKIKDVAAVYYDQGCRDLYEIADRMGEPFEPAEKSHEIGVPILNSLFKHDMLLLYDHVETRKLATELSSIDVETAKNKAKDDLADALRYACSKVGWDFSAIAVQAEDREKPAEKTKTPMEIELDERRAAFDKPNPDETQSFDDECEMWNELYEG